MAHEISYMRKITYEIHEFPELLARAGHEVTFLEFDEGARSPNFGLKSRDKLISGKVYKDSKIRLLTPFQLGIPSIDRLWAVLSSIPVILRVLKRKDFDVVLNYAVPTFGLWVLLVAKMRKIPIVYRSLDVSHLMVSQSKWNFLIEKFESFIYRHSDGIAANNDCLLAYCLKSRVGLQSPSSKFRVILPPVDVKHFAPKPMGTRKTPEGVVNILYLGTFFYFSGLDAVLKSAKEQKALGAQFKLTLVGGGVQDEMLRRMVVDLGLDQEVAFTGFVDFFELSRYLESADVCINAMEVSQVSNLALPHKCLQYAAAGKQIVSTRLCGMDSVSDGRKGITFVERPSEVFEKAIAVASEPPSDEFISFVQTEFKPSQAKKKLEEFLESFIS